MRAICFGFCLVAVTLSPSSAQVANNQAPSCQAVISPSDTEFGRISVVAPGPDGRLAWSDGRSGQFSIRDSRGRVRTIGRQGSGPGEFQYVGGMDWIGDSIWVADGRMPRVQTFSDTGRILRTTTAVLPAAWGVVARDSLAGFGSIPLARDVPFAVLSYSQGATRMDTVTTFDLVPAERFALPPAMAMNKQPLMPETEIGSSPNHRRFCAARPASSEEVQLRCVDYRGRRLLDSNVRLEPRPLSDAIFEATVKRFVNDPRRTEAVVRDLLRRPRSLPLVLGIMVSNDGKIWLGRSHDSESSSIWTRIRPDGSIQGVITLPSGQRLLRVDANVFWSTTTDSDGLQTVHRCSAFPS